jgi:type I restriction enzyme S subunit
MELKTFFDNFETMAEAPNGVQKLREMILQLAVQGKLVPQDPNDEPASVLLEKIRAAMERLVRAKAIKRPKFLPVINEGEIPYEIPYNWSWSRIGTIGQVVGGGTPKTGHDEYFAKNGIPWLTPADLYRQKTKYIDRGKRDISELGLKNSSAQLMPKGAVLFSSRAPIGYVAIALNSISTNQGFKSCVPYIMDMNEYVYWFFKFAAKDIDQRASGTTFKEVSGKIVGEILIPVPPLNEQKRIVAKVDELMALCDDLEARKQKTRQTCIQLNDACIDKMLTSDEPARFNKHWQRIHTNFDLLYSQPENVNKLRQAILQLAVQGKLVPQDPNDEPASVLLEKIRAERNNYLGKKALKKRALLPPVFPENLADCIPESWVFDRFGNLAMISGGLTLGRKLSGRKIGVFQYLRVANVQRWYVDLSNVKKVEVPLDELEKYKLLKGDILITEGGDWDKVGRAVIWENQIENCLHQNHIFKARFFNGMLYREWIVLFLNSPTGRSYFAEASKQTTNLASINMTQLRNCVLPIPPLNEQKRIVAKVDQLMALCDDLEAKLQKSQKRNDRLMEAAVAEMLAA